MVNQPRRRRRARFAAALGSSAGESEMLAGNLQRQRCGRPAKSCHRRSAVPIVQCGSAAVAGFGAGCGMKLLVTGGAGFIGSAVCRLFVGELGIEVLNVDKLTYAANLASLGAIEHEPRYRFDRADICDRTRIAALLAEFAPDAVLHLAAESHVDRSIDGPGDFIRTNIEGTYTLLDAALDYWRSLPAARAQRFRFHHVSTDEVFGSLGPAGRFSEASRYEPNSPYAASKAAADHLVRAWHATFGLPIVLSNCSNNYGPYHFPEKLIPLAILKAVHGEPIPIYGRGDNVRDWLYVEDHARALYAVLTAGRPGASYNIGGDGERTNLAVVTAICDLLDELLPDAAHRPHAKLIQFVADRPGHDRRYAIDAGKIRAELGWRPRQSFASGLRQTVRWYLDNRWWWEPIWSGRYGGARLGVGQTKIVTAGRDPAIHGKQHADHRDKSGDDAVAGTPSNPPGA
jgi:dTDP-glucose 4,6-dehydratase